jgi:hypothetical protein
MCANCVSRFDVVVGSAAVGVYALKGPVRDALVAAGIVPEPHPLAVNMRTVAFLRDLELDPAPILGADVVEAVDRAQAFPRARVYRRSFRDAIALLTGRSMRSQRVLATQYTR